MADQSDVRRLALALPEAVAERGEFAFSVGGKNFVWLWRERVDPKKPKVPNPEVVVVRVVDEEEKRALLASEPDVVFTEPHYDGYKAVLVRLPAVGEQLLAELLADSWRTVAPLRLRTALDPDA